MARGAIHRFTGRPGIEFTARWDSCQAPGLAASLGQDIDILAYFINPQDNGLQVLCDELMADLRQRISACCELMRAAGYPISIFDVSVENPHYPGASQLIKALCRRGHASDWNSAFELFARFWPRVRTSQFTAQDVIQAAHAAGASPSWRIQLVFVLKDMTC